MMIATALMLITLALTQLSKKNDIVAESDVEKVCTYYARLPCDLPAKAVGENQTD